MRVDLAAHATLSVREGREALPFPLLCECLPPRVTCICHQVQAVCLPVASQEIGDWVLRQRIATSFGKLEVQEDDELES